MNSYGLARALTFAFAVLVTICGFILLISGGLVTSKGVGMTVPDWPNSYGYNMFTFPISRWVGGIFYEHVHRLIASGVGLLTVMLAVLLWFGEPRKWVRVLGYVAVVAVIVQGILGGLRVTLIKDEIGIFHGMFAQAYISLLVVIAVALSRAFATGGARWRWHAPGLLRWAIVLTVLIYLQLAIGATMRHEHAGLAIRDFPLAYGQLWPQISPAELVEINTQRIASGEVPNFASTSVTFPRVIRASENGILDATRKQVLSGCSSHVWCVWSSVKHPRRLESPGSHHQRHASTLQCASCVSHVFVCLVARFVC
jgi:cytochrome c oxidase assembly protein subunit 15